MLGLRITRISIHFVEERKTELFRVSCNDKTSINEKLIKPLDGKQKELRKKFVENDLVRKKR
jgi:hypothetical protein